MALLWYNKAILKEVYKMPQIIPIKDLKNTADVSELCHATDEPIFVTKNGYGDMVLMSMETYERNMKLSHIYQELDVSERQITEGRIKDAREHLASLKTQYGL